MSDRRVIVQQMVSAEHVRTLHAEAGGDVMVWGGIALCRSRFAAGQVDELRYRVER